MAVTLLDAAIQSGPTPVEAAVVKQFVQVSPILDRLPMVKIDGNSYSYNIEDTLPSVSWRSVNEAWSESTGTLRPATERLHILGGEVKVDRFLERTNPNRARSLRSTQYQMKVQAASNEFDRAFFEGDSLVNPNEMVGLRQRIGGAQLLEASTTGATLTLDMLHELIDTIPFDRIELYMNKTMRRKITKLIESIGGSVRLDVGYDTYGKQVERFGRARINIVERMGDASTILGFDESPSGDSGADCTSIYALSFGNDRVHGIWNGDKPVQVEEFGVLESEPRYMGRIEGYVGLVIQNPRAAARLSGITNT
jgi:hypothetical protein